MLHYRVPLMTADARDAATTVPPDPGRSPGRSPDAGPDDGAAPVAADPHRVRDTALVVATYVVLAVIVYWQAWSNWITTHLQLGGDQYANVWFLRWTPFALLHGLNPFFTTYANYPYGVNLVTNTSSPLLGVLGMPVTLVAGSIATFNVLSTVALAGTPSPGAGRPGARRRGSRGCCTGSRPTRSDRRPVTSISPSSSCRR